MKKILLIGVISLLAGCTVGQSEFNCSKGDENALCASSRTIYHATDGDLPENTDIVYIKDGEAHQTNLAEINELKNEAVVSKSSDGAQPRTSVPYRFSYDGDVLRQDVKVLRIWIAPFVDKQDDLHLSTLVYTDIEKRKWHIGTVDRSSTGARSVAVRTSTAAITAEQTRGEESEQKYRPSEKDIKRMNRNLNN